MYTCCSCSRQLRPETRKPNLTPSGMRPRADAECWRPCEKADAGRVSCKPSRTRPHLLAVTLLDVLRGGVGRDAQDVVQGSLLRHVGVSMMQIPRSKCTECASYENSRSVPGVRACVSDGTFPLRPGPLWPVPESLACSSEMFRMWLIAHVCARLLIRVRACVRACVFSHAWPHLIC